MLNTQVWKDNLTLCAQNKTFVSDLANEAHLYLKWPIIFFSNPSFDFLRRKKDSCIEMQNLRTKGPHFML